MIREPLSKVMARERAAHEALLPPVQGWIVLCLVRHGEYEPMSYGYGEEPHHDRLAKRGRATLFPDRDLASAALSFEHAFATDNGERWIAGAKFQLVPVYADKLPFVGSEATA
jgi:hypothetical protein